MDRRRVVVGQSSATGEGRKNKLLMGKFNIKLEPLSLNENWLKSPKLSTSSSSSSLTMPLVYILIIPFKWPIFASKLLWVVPNQVRGLVVEVIWNNFGTAFFRPPLSCDRISGPLLGFKLHKSLSWGCRTSTWRAFPCPPPIIIPKRSARFRVLFMEELWFCQFKLQEQCCQSVAVVPWIVKRVGGRRRWGQIFRGSCRKVASSHSQRSKWNNNLSLSHLQSFRHNFSLALPPVREAVLVVARFSSMYVGGVKE